MLIQPELEKLLPKVDNRYTLAILISKRVRQLLSGALPLVESDSQNLVTLASKELAKDKIAYVKGQASPYIPLRPEVEAARLAARAAAEQADLADAVKDALDQAAGIESSSDLGADDARIISESLMSAADAIEEDIPEEQDEPSDEYEEEPSDAEESN